MSCILPAERVESFKNIARKVFENYQSSRIETLKWHAWSDSVGLRQDGGGLE